MNDVSMTHRKQTRADGKQERSERKKDRPKELHRWGNPKPITIRVYLHSVGPPPDYIPDFDIVTTEPTKGGGHNPPIQFNNGSFNITFNLFDLTGRGYRFAKDPDDAVWSQLGTTCPMTRVQDVFSDMKVKGPTTLWVFNENPDIGGGDGQGYFQYTLNVTTDKQGNGPPYVHLDPGGNNNNGSSRW